jgi:hypothetical protein
MQTQTPTPVPSLVISIASDGPQFNNPDDWCGRLFEVVADATIGTLGPSHWNTPDYSPPPSLDEKTILNGGYTIFTPIQFSRMQPLVDHRDQPTEEFMNRGGQVGSVKIRVEDVPSLSVGRRYIMLFEPGPDRQLRAYTETRLLLAAAFPVDTQGMVVLQAAYHGGGENVPEQTMPLTQIQQKLTACQ